MSQGELARLEAARRRARRSAIVALVAAPLSLVVVLLIVGNLPGAGDDDVLVDVGVATLATGVVALAATQLLWWRRSRRLRSASPGQGVLVSPRAKAVADLRRASAFLACDACWLAMSVLGVALAARAEGFLPRSLTTGIANSSWLLLLTTVFGLVALLGAAAKAGVTAGYRVAQGPHPVPIRPAGSPGDYAALADRTAAAARARTTAVRTLVVGFIGLVVLGTGEIPAYGGGGAVWLAPTGAAFYLGCLPVFAATQIRWWARARASHALEARLVARTPVEHGWLKVRRLVVACLVGGGWVMSFNPLGDIAQSLMGGGRTRTALVVLRVGLPITMIAILVTLALAAVLVVALAGVVLAGLRQRAGRERPVLSVRTAPSTPEGAELHRLRASARSARRLAVGVLLGSLAVLTAVSSFLMPLHRVFPGVFPEGRADQLLDTGQAVYVLSFVAWPLLIGSHYHWWQRSRRVLAAERRLLGPARKRERRTAQLRRLGVGMLVAFGWFQVFYAGPSLAIWYEETGQSQVASNLLRSYAPLPLYGLVFLVSFWVEPLIERGRAALQQFAAAEVGGSGRYSWRKVLPWVSRSAWALLALTFLPLYLENWGFWNPPRPLFLTMLVVEAVVLVIALGAGWWHGRRRQEGAPSQRS